MHWGWPWRGAPATPAETARGESAGKFTRPLPPPPAPPLLPPSRQACGPSLSSPGLTVGGAHFYCWVTKTAPGRLCRCVWGCDRAGVEGGGTMREREAIFRRERRARTRAARCPSVDLRDRFGGEPPPVPPRHPPRCLMRAPPGWTRGCRARLLGTFPREAGGGCEATNLRDEGEAPPPSTLPTRAARPRPSVCRSGTPIRVPLASEASGRPIRAGGGADCGGWRARAGGGAGEG